MPGLEIPLEHVLLLAATLFSLGLMGLMLRRNIIFMLMSLEVMLNAAGLAFVAAGARWGQADGQVIFLLILSVAAAEVAVVVDFPAELGGIGWICVGAGGGSGSGSWPVIVDALR